MNAAPLAAGKEPDMAGLSTRPDEPVAAINITPFVDVVLVLLVALMVTATDLAAQSIGVELPRAATGTDAPPKTLAISVDSEGRTLLDGLPVTDDALRARIRDAYAHDPEVRAVLAADGRVAHARVVSVVDMLRKEKVTRFALEVKPGG
jgi:biopolymer transport protein ExbD